MCKVRREALAENGGLDMERQYELKLSNGKVVIWEGINGEQAAYRYVDCLPGTTVIAWREYPRHGIFLGVQNVIE